MLLLAMRIVRLWAQIITENSNLDFYYATSSDFGQSKICMEQKK